MGGGGGVWCKYRSTGCRKEGDGNGGVRGDVGEKGLSAEDVYDRATWRCVSSNIEVGPRQRGRS